MPNQSNGIKALKAILTKNTAQTHEAEYEMIGAENQQETVRLLVELLLHLVVHTGWVVRRQFVHNELLRQLDLNKRGILAVTCLKKRVMSLYKYSSRYQTDQSHHSKS